MAWLEDLPTELLSKILYLATHPDHPMALEHPLVNWHSPSSMFFKRTRNLQRHNLATKASIALVCQRWNKLSVSWLYEHITIDNTRKLQSITMSQDASDSSRTRESLSAVRRLDVDLPEIVGDEGSAFVRIAALLKAVPKITTLVMFLPWRPCTFALIWFIPESVARLYWSTPMDESRTMPKAPIQLRTLLTFLDHRPRLETISLPFVLSPGATESMSKYAPRAPHRSIRELIIQNGLQWDLFRVVGIQQGPTPRAVSRAVTFDMDTQDLTMTSLLTSLSSYPQPVPGAAPGPRLKITELSMVVQLVDRAWPPPFLVTNLPTIQTMCPDLRNFNFTLTADAPDIFAGPMDPVIVGVPPVPQVTSVSIQRVVTGENEMDDPEGTFHHVLLLPWVDVFPGLRSIRIREDIDLEAVLAHPAMAIVRDKGWKIGIEDRFGESLL
ncbi:hypothetical protein NMY22_g15226 [Coprinellus aureogranulatus]|nr:hypothetical protein NMY22_g15226 [Coprinellus aureogranulatus]